MKNKERIDGNELAAQFIRDAGFEEVRWHDAEASGYYQPVATARNR